MTIGTGEAGQVGGGARLLAALNLHLSRLERLLIGISAAGIFVMMVVLMVDVFGRYLFNRPLAWSYDFISIYLMPLVVFLALSETFRRNDHISVDLLYRAFGAVVQRCLRLLAAIVVCLVVAPISWLAVLQASHRFQNNVVISGSILWPTWIPSLFLAAGTALLIVRAALDGVALLRVLIVGTDDIPGESLARHERHEMDAGEAL